MTPRAVRRENRCSGDRPSAELFKPVRRIFSALITMTWSPMSIYGVYLRVLFAAQNAGGFSRQSAQRLAGGIDDEPLAGNLERAWYKCRHLYPVLPAKPSHRHAIAHAKRLRGQIIPTVTIAVRVRGAESNRLGFRVRFPVHAADTTQKGRRGTAQGLQNSRIRTESQRTNTLKTRFRSAFSARHASPYPPPSPVGITAKLHQSAISHPQVTR